MQLDRFLFAGRVRIPSSHFCALACRRSPIFYFVHAMREIFLARNRGWHCANQNFVARERLCFVRGSDVRELSVFLGYYRAISAFWRGQIQGLRDSVREHARYTDRVLVFAPTGFVRYAISRRTSANKTSNAWGRRAQSIAYTILGLHSCSKLYPQNYDKAIAFGGTV